MIDGLNVDPASERPIYAYQGAVPGEMFALIVYRCPSCGMTGKADSWCNSHSPPMGTGDALRVKRQPVLVPHADGPAETEIYDFEPEGGQGS